MPDSLKKADRDTLTAFSPLSVRLPAFGESLPGTDTLSFLHSLQIKRTDAVSVAEPLGRSADFFLWDLGEPGQNSQLVYRGLDWRSITLSLDGVPLNEPISQAFNLYDVPIEFVQDFEVTSSALAMTSPGTTPGATLNAVSNQYISYRPTTKIRYLQGPYGQTFSDGLFTQNLGRTTNLLVAFQRHAADGRFTNASYDAWNIRSRVRFDVSERLNVAITYLFTKRVNGTNGGVFIDSTRTIFQGAGATVRYPEATETLWRHDIALHVLGTLFADTTLLTRATAYYTLNERDYRDPTSPVYSNPALDRTHVGGLRLEQDLRLLVLDATIGADLQTKNVTASPHIGVRNERTGAVWGRAAMDLWGFLRPQAQVREDFFEDQRLVSYGASLMLGTERSWDFLVSASSLWRVPTLQERFWSGPYVTRMNQIVNEKHRVIEASARVRPWEGATFSIAGFRRWIDDGVVFIGSSPAAARETGVNILAVPTLELQGVTLDAFLPIWRFGVHLTGGFNEYREQDTLKTLLPKFRGMLDVFFRDRFFGDNLDLKVGARVQGVSRHQGMEFVPPMLTYVTNRGQEVGRSATLDLYGVFQIGDAFVTLAWENITNVEYYVTPVYPMIDRSIRLGIDWQFLD